MRLALLLYFSNFAFNKVEEQLRRPFHFVFDLDQARQFEDAGKTLPIKESEIEEVNIAGSFNGWANPNFLESRLEDLASEGEILIGPETYDKVKEIVEVRALSPRAVKGKAEEIRIYVVTGMKG